MCSFWWAEYSSGFNHSSISRKRRKRNVPYLSLGEREEETLLSYVTCRKLKLSQILCIIDGGHKVWGEGSVRWKKWVINWALGLNENSFKGCTKKGSKGWAKWLQGWRKSVEIIYGRSLVDSWQWPGGLPVQHNWLNMTGGKHCQVIFTRFCRKTGKIVDHTFVSQWQLSCHQNSSFYGIKFFLFLSRIDEGKSKACNVFLQTLQIEDLSFLSLEILLFAFAIKRGYYWVTYWPFSR